MQTDRMLARGALQKQPRFIPISEGTASC